MMTSLRLVRTGSLPRAHIRSPRDTYRVLKPLAYGLDREHFWRLDLDSRRQLLGCELISMGSLTASMAHPREVFKGALLNNAHSIMIAHNHPSQAPSPSSADQQTTRRLRRVGHLLRIELVDHLILTDRAYFSFKTARLL
jgi:DNA repair protein RadC